MPDSSLDLFGAYRRNLKVRPWEQRPVLLRLIEAIFICLGCIGLVMLLIFLGSLA